MTPLDMHYDQDLLFSVDAQLARLFEPPHALPASALPKPPLALRGLSHPAPTRVEPGCNPAALRHAIAAERGPAGWAERLVQAIDCNSLASTISVVLAYLAIMRSI
jgi:hypothetical protein